jgi:catechol 2,3-dioxygenase-like lactoylglutathione lyase family enzyme
VTESSGTIFAGDDRPEERGAGTAPRMRFHVHIAVEDLEASIRFYSALFAAQPAVTKSDYAKWMLEDPRVNFAISRRGAQTGVQHLGIQVESHAELEEVYARLKRAARPVLEEGATTCCYAQSEKSWITDPQGVQWEAFLTTGESTVYGHDPQRVGEAQSVASSCCTPSCCAPAAT